jgi:hypothetical protein
MAALPGSRSNSPARGAPLVDRSFRSEPPWQLRAGAEGGQDALLLTPEAGTQWRLLLPSTMRRAPSDFRALPSETIAAFAAGELRCHRLGLTVV